MMCEVNSCMPKRNGARFAEHRRGGAALLLFIIATFDTANAAGLYVEAGAVGSNLDTHGFVEQLVRDDFENFGNERSAGWRVAGGYRIARYLAVEAGFADFGEKTPPDAAAAMGNSFTTFLRDTRITLRGPYGALVGSLPIGHWDAFVKIGALRAHTAETTHVVTSLRFPVRPSIENDVAESASTTELLLGIGVTYRITDHYGVVLEATRVPKVGDPDATGEGDLTSLSLSAQYSF